MRESTIYFIIGFIALFHAMASYALVYTVNNGFVEYILLMEFLLGYFLWVYLFMRGKAKMFKNNCWSTVMCKIVISMVIIWSVFILLLAYL